jgi:hypothetical protein
MSDEVPTAWIKAVPQCLGIMVLAALFIAGIGGNPLAESPLRIAEQRLKTGMSFSESCDAMKIGWPQTGGSTLTNRVEFWIDDARGEALRLHFDLIWDQHAGQFRDHLSGWNVDKATRPRSTNSRANREKP